MFTLIRPLSAVFLAVFALIAAQAYAPIYDSEADLGRFPLYAAAVSFLIGWRFLGRQIGKALWLSVFAAWQAVVLAAVATAMFLAVGEVFRRGYRRQYGEVIEAITGYFGIVVDWLSRGLVQEFLILLAAGGTIIGVVLHILWVMLEARRHDR
ncbi:TrgA family protein [Pararhodobacter oceanensis]|uniref:TrgA family protein n=1 Tax=Pararhodobacter oceanensis TaxID=2172121 RepID=UPI003A918AF9